jgi:hypothetical protein
LASENSSKSRHAFPWTSAFDGFGIKINNEELKNKYISIENKPTYSFTFQETSEQVSLCGFLF